MARGWESKGVEQQQAETEALLSSQKPSRNAEQTKIDRQRESLRLQRSYVLAQLGMAKNQHHRTLLEAALADLNAQLEEVR
jgi:hypothetical protein